jgi:hypothetical protein
LPDANAITNFLKLHRDLKRSQPESKDLAIGTSVLQPGLKGSGLAPKAFRGCIEVSISFGMTGQMRGKFANFF